MNKEKEKIILENINLTNRELSKLTGYAENYISSYICKNKLRRIPILEEGEEFKDIPGYPNYKVSNHGRIINLKNNKLIKPYLDKSNEKGLRIELKGENNKTKRFFINRLVFITFKPEYIPKDKAYHIKFKDGNIRNNNIENLYITETKDFVKVVTDKNVKIICEMLQDKRKISEIRNLLDKRGVKVSYAYIYKIKTRKSRKDISKNYVF